MNQNIAEDQLAPGPGADELELDQVADEFCAAWAQAVRDGKPLPLPAAFATRVSPDRRSALLELLRKVEDELRNDRRAPRLPGYELGRVIADRNMAIVYEAIEQATGRRVVVKVLRSAERDRFARQEEFWGEDREVIAGLEHAHIVPILHVGAHEGCVFLVMPLIEGGDLWQRLAEFTLSEPLPLNELRRRVKLIEQVARAADYVHRRGVIHRDLKPSNILIGEGNRALVCDFGLARRLRDRVRLTITGQLLGTLPYMAPEQARGERHLTVAVDIWAIGAILYELLTGHAPFCKDDPIPSVLLQRKTERGATPPLPSDVVPGSAINRDLEWICMRCLEHNPDDRFASARELVEALERFRYEQQVPLQPSIGRRVRTVVARAADIVSRPPAQPDYIRRWRWALRTEAFTAPIAHGTVLALTLSGAPAPWVWAAFLLGDTVCGLLIWYLFLGRRRLTPMERSVMQLWAGADLTAMFLFALTVPLSRPPDAAAIGTFYTSYLLIRALVLFIEGRMCWGKLYWVSATFYAAAGAVQFVPAYAPAIYGAVYSLWFLGNSFCRWETVPDAAPALEPSPSPNRNS
jgi:serine/threonine protein kinase